MPQQVIPIRLEPADEHWIQLNNPMNICVDTGDWWLNQSTLWQSGVRGTIDLYIPEMDFIIDPTVDYAILELRFKQECLGTGCTGAGALIGLQKSKDQQYWIGAGGIPDYQLGCFNDLPCVACPFDQIVQVQLDPAYKYYRIIFSDGWKIDIFDARMYVHKDAKLTLQASVLPPPPPPPAEEKLPWWLIILASIGTLGLLLIKKKKG